jgi:hypothetical protein
MFGTQTYSEGAFKPQRGAQTNWNVWCTTGALEVLNSDEYTGYLERDPSQWYVINFANGSSARIQPGHPLWQKLLEVSKIYDVAVYPLTLQGKYTSWTGNETSLHSFDAIRITSKKSVANNSLGMSPAQIESE